MTRREAKQLWRQSIKDAWQNRCAYCDNPPIDDASLTLDHVRPLSLGGTTAWDNIVAACQRCNTQKGNKMIMKPKRKPYEPNYYELVNKRKQLDFNVRHPVWNSYL